MCRNKKKRNHVYDLSSFYSDTFPLILVFYAAFMVPVVNKSSVQLKGVSDEIFYFILYF